MKTATTEMIYEPVARRMTFKRNGKAVGGLTGPAAEREFSEAIQNGRPVKIGKMSSKSMKIRRLRALWIKQGIDQYRESILEPYGVSSTAALNEGQLDELINRFAGSTDAPKAVRQARSVVIMLLQKLGVYNNDGNWARVNEFMMDKRIAGKLLYQMNEAELKALSVKLRGILAKSRQKFNPMNN